MRITSTVVVIGSLLAACDPADDPLTVSIETQAAPALVMYRDVDQGTWAVPAADTTGHHFTFEPGGTYRVLVVCESGDPDFAVVVVQQTVRTLEDDPVIEMPCDARETPFVVSGTLAGAGEVALYNRFTFSSSTIPWEFQLSSPAGLGSLIARTDDGHLEVRRRILIDADRDVGVIDPAAQGVALVPVPFAVNNTEAGEVVQIGASLLVDGTRAFLPSEDADLTASLVPASAVQPLDQQTVFLLGGMPPQGDGPRFFRTVERDQRVGDAATVAFPPRLAPITFEQSGPRHAATWTTLPEHERVTLTTETFGDDRYVMHTIEATRAALDGRTELAMSTDELPSFQPAWALEAGVEIERAFRAVRGDRTTGIGELSSWMTDTIGGPAPRRPHAAGATAHAMVRRLTSRTGTSSAGSTIRSVGSAVR